MEVQQQPEETPQDLREAKSNLTALLKHPGWKLVQDYYEKNSEWRKNKILLTQIGQPDSQNEVWSIEKQEYMKGEVAALMLAAKLPLVLIDTIEHSLHIAKQDEENDNAEAS